MVHAQNVPLGKKCSTVLFRLFPFIYTYYFHGRSAVFGRKVKCSTKKREMFHFWINVPLFPVPSAKCSTWQKNVPLYYFDSSHSFTCIIFAEDRQFFGRKVKCSTRKREMFHFWINVPLFPVPCAKCSTWKKNVPLYYFDSSHSFTRIISTFVW